MAFRWTAEQRGRAERGAATALSVGLGLASVVVLVMLGVALETGFYVPLMTDEVGTKLYARIFEEEGNQISLLPMCTSSWVQKTPLLLYPGAVISTLAYGGLGLVGIKVSAILLSVFALAGVAWLAWQGIPGRADRLAAAAGLSAVCALGVVPFVLLLSRSELTMKTCLVAYCLLPALARRWGGRRAVRLGLGLVYLLVSSLFFYAHPKALFFLPFVVASGALSAPPGLRRRFLAVALPCVLVMAWQSYRLSVDALRCDESPAVSSFFANISLSPRLLFTDPGAFLDAGVGNVLETPTRAWKEVLFAANNTGWVPLPRSPRLPEDMRELNARTGPVFAALFVVAPLLLALAYRRRPVARENVALGAALVLGLGANAFFYNVLPYYNCGLFMPALGMIAALALSADPGPLLPRAPRLSRAVGGVLLLGLLVLAAQNLGALVGYFGPKLRENASRVGPVVPDQPLAVPIFGYEAERTKIRALARACGIEGDSARHLVIDDYTMLSFEHLREPLNLLYVTDAIPLLGKPLGGEKVKPFLRGLESPGIVGRCWLFPKALRPKVTASGDYCCVGAEAFTASTPP